MYAQITPASSKSYARSAYIRICALRVLSASLVSECPPVSEFDVRLSVSAFTYDAAQEPILHSHWLFPKTQLFSCQLLLLVKIETQTHWDGL